MVKNHKFGTVWQRALAVFSLNDPGWGRGAGKDGESGTPGKEHDKGERAGERPARNEQNRPPNGGREGGGPPDLDELWRDFNQRLNRLFNRKGGGSGGKPSLDGGGPSRRAGTIGALVLLCLAVLVWLCSGIYIVQEGQAGVVLRFGRYVYTTPAGIQWRAPYPFEANEIVNMSQVRSIEIGRNGTIRETNLKDSSMLTSDGNIIDVRFAVQYRIKDASDFLFNNADAEANVAQAAETAVREIVGKSKMDYVLYEGREQVAIELAASIQRILDAYATGILVTSVTMQNVQPPEQVQAAFDDAVKAGQDRERQKNEAQAYANDVVPRARGTAARMLEEAQGYKARIVAQAEGDAARFDAVQAEYAKAPAVTRERMYLDTMQQIYSKSSKVLVDSKANNSMLYLPLDKLLAQTAQPGPAPRDRAPAAAAPADGASDAAVSDNDLAAARASAGVDPLRSRSLFRSRGRSEELQDIR
ncbi:FtsH protease activity modulator HflK [Robbsia sp. Bb-Pol-6]|uniref:Protein HflK n=1 Tax=Robbsia betulipollinis TaxID=2981849 RepID=A0ABT3ZNF1_9BURK|nr:FtsH protease activity modulator HflK [Robbsia betulipollinis]MCY0388076.1 FtsH protease activity modulator HflK [Robbsia betulipollinis]